MSGSSRNLRGFRPITVIFWLLAIFNVLCCALRRPPSPFEEGSLAEILGAARDERRSEKGSSKAIGHYRRIIDSQLSTDETSSLKRGRLEGDNSHVSEALFELSEILEGSYRNVSAMSEGFELLVRAASAGHVRAQHRLAVAYATGLYGASLMPMDAGKALLLEYMAALGGSPEASMGMGYRYLYGIGVPENCETARDFYEYAANVAADQIRKRGLPIHSERVKISDVEVTASNGRRDVDAEVVDYYKHMVSVGGDTSAAHTLGGMYLQGSRFIEQDLEKAMYYLQVAADVGNVPASGQLGYLMAQQLTLKMSNYNKKYPEKSQNDDKVDKDENSQKAEAISEEDLAQNEEILQLSKEVKAMMKLLKYAANRDDAHGLVGIGYVHFTGLTDIPLRNGSSVGDIKAARNISMSYNAFFKVQGRHSDAGFYMGEILMGRGQALQAAPTPQTILEKQNDPGFIPITDVAFEVKLEGQDAKGADAKGDLPTIVKIDPVAAVRAYAASSQRGNMLALHRLSHLATAGVGMVRSCQTAVTGFKAVAERGDWAHDLTRAHRLFDAGDRVAALVLFSSLAAVGLESSQFNTAYLLMKTTDLPWLQLSTSFVTVDTTHVGGTEPIVSGHRAEGSVSDTAAATSISVDAPQKEQQEWGSKSIRKTRTSPVSAISVFSNEVNNSIALFQQLGTKANCEARALALYAVSASQSSAESLLRVGDCFYYGCGGLSRDKVEAAMYYQLAADLRSTHAIFNLGLMHEAGDGVQQDFHLAKRFYDQAAEADSDAKLPRAVALFLLSSHRSLQDYLGVDATEQLATTALKMVAKALSYYRMGMKRLVELLPKGLDLDSRARSARGSESGTHRGGDGVGSFLGTVQGSVNRLIVSSEANLVDNIAIAGLSLVFLCVWYWKRSRRERLRQHQHLD